MIDWDRACEMASEREWSREDLAEEFNEWVAEWDIDEPEHLMGVDEDARWSLFFDSSNFDNRVHEYAEQIHSGDF